MKKIISSLFLSFVVFFAFHQSADANTELTFKQKKELLTQAALNRGIPPEILKAIAYKETGMMQFENGEPVRNKNGDGGIGMMQVTLTDSEASQRGVDLNRVGTDTAYNIEVGADILLEKWSYSFVPRINGHDKSNLENWYFAIMGYNGYSKVNDPDFDPNPYQKDVYDYIENNSLLHVNNPPDFYVEYPNGNNIMFFPEDKRHYLQVLANTRSSQMYNAGDKVYSYNDHAGLNYSNLRLELNSSSSVKVDHLTPLTIVSGPYETDNATNQYVYYEVKGNGIQGYMSSSNLRNRLGEAVTFNDAPNDPETQKAIRFLVLKGTLTGYEGNVFKPQQSLSRRHAAVILVRELGLTLPNGYEPNFTDIKPGDLYYEEMITAEAYGLLKGRNGRMDPVGSLTRSQMAEILVRAYGEFYEDASRKHTFKDQSYIWNYENVNLLYDNGITIADPFRPNEAVTRSQFALFLSRTLEDRKD